MKKIGTSLALLSGIFYAISIPFSKILLTQIGSTLLAGLLYLGAGIGIGIIYLIKKIFFKQNKELNLSKKDFPYVLLMVLLDIAAPILLLLGINFSSTYSVSLISNFELIATSLIATIIFKEKNSLKVYCGIIIVFIASLLLMIDFNDGIKFSWGLLFVLMACIVWGFENNCTKKIAEKSPYQITIIKGIFSGIGSIILGLILNEKINDYSYLLYSLLLGFFSFGLSVFLYVLAQRYLGASKTSLFYAINPFVGCGLSLIIFKNSPNWNFYLALALMVVGLFMVIYKKKEVKTDQK